MPPATPAHRRRWLARWTRVVTSLTVAVALALSGGALPGSLEARPSAPAGTAAGALLAADRHTDLDAPAVGLDAAGVDWAERLDPPDRSLLPGPVQPDEDATRAAGPLPLVPDAEPTAVPDWAVRPPAGGQQPAAGPRAPPLR